MATRSDERAARQAARSAISIPVVITGGIYSWYDGNAWKSALSGKGLALRRRSSWAAATTSSSASSSTAAAATTRTGPNDYIYTYGSTPAYGYTQLPWHDGGQKKSLGFFVDDTYRLGWRTTLNLGLRYDWSRASIRSSPVLDPQGQRDLASPRPCARQRLTWNSVAAPRSASSSSSMMPGTSTVKLHAGRYYGGIVTSEFDNISPVGDAAVLFDGTYRQRAAESRQPRAGLRQHAA